MQVLVAAFGLWKQEWAYAHQMISDDCRNNSAWNQRAWLLGKSLEVRLERNSGTSSTPHGQLPDQALTEDPDDLQPRFLSGSITDWFEREVQYVQDHVGLTPHNESAWNYLVGLTDVVNDVLRIGTAQGELLSSHFTGLLASRYPSTR